MISDDFWYGQKNINLVSTTIHHYLTWSGRLLTDITSRILLQCPSWIISGIKTLVLVLLIILISTLPSQIQKSEHNRFSNINLFLLFIIYWICNPNLGQTTFWTVGTSNYLFTSLWILVYLNLAFHFFNHKTVWYQDILLVLVAFGAGLSNENTGPMMVIFSMGMLIYSVKTQQQIKTWLIGLSGNVIGAAVLLLSPGNWLRQQTLPPEFRNTLTLPNFYRFFNDGTAVKLFSNYGFLFLIFAVIIGLLFWKKTVSRSAILWSMIFFAMAVVSNFALILSPYVIIRALQGGFIFLLISLSFLINELIQNLQFKPIKQVYIVLISVLTVMFVISYILEVHSFKLAQSESNIRLSMIMNAENKKQANVAIPSWYFGTLLRPQNDGYDPYLSTYYGQYYGYKGQYREVEVPFDYTNIRNFEQPNYRFNNNQVIRGIKLIPNKNAGTTTVILLLKNPDKRDVINLNLKSDNYDLPLSNVLKIKQHEFVSVSVNGKVSKADLRGTILTVTNNGNVKEKITIKK